LAQGESFNDAPNLELDVHRRQLLHQVKKDVRHLKKCTLKVSLNDYPYGWVLLELVSILVQTLI
jgi:hypothetical protein